MSKPRISAIAAIGENRELGKAGGLLWHIQSDMKRLKELTMGHPLIMGRKTYESIGKPLPGRTMIVVTRNTSYDAPGCIVVHSLNDALKTARELEDEEIFIFGGAELYKEALPVTERLYLTLVHASDQSADTFFPSYEAFTKEITREDHSDDVLPFSWVTLERD